MGWSHAVNMCHEVVLSCIQHAGVVSPSMMVCFSDGAIVAYVDNVVCFSTSREKSEELLKSVTNEFERRGLLVHVVCLGITSLESLAGHLLVRKALSLLSQSVSGNCTMLWKKP